MVDLAACRVVFTCDDRPGSSAAAVASYGQVAATLIDLQALGCARVARKRRQKTFAAHGSGLVSDASFSAPSQMRHWAGSPVLPGELMFIRWHGNSPCAQPWSVS